MGKFDGILLIVAGGIAVWAITRGLEQRRTEDSALSGPVITEDTKAVTFDKVFHMLEAPIDVSTSTSSLTEIIGFNQAGDSVVFQQGTGADHVVSATVVAPASLSSSEAHNYCQSKGYTTTAAARGIPTDNPYRCVS